MRCWTATSLNEMLQRRWELDWLTKQALGEAEDPRFISVHVWEAEQSSIRASQSLFTRRIRLARSCALSNGHSVCLHKPIVRPELRSLWNHLLTWHGFLFFPFISSSLLAIPNKLRSLHLCQDIPLETSPTHSSFFLKARPLHVAGPGHFSAQSFLLSKSWPSATVNALEKHYMWKAIRKTARETEKDVWGLPRWSSGSDPMLPMQEAQVQPLIRELDPTCHN